tara:strand:- start:170 stop:406 length:237 start_codon:yes stop_codon:yes gene_type:complete
VNEYEEGVEVVDTADGCGCGFIHRDCSTGCSGCDTYWCEDCFEKGGDIQGDTYCVSCYSGMMEAIGDHHDAGREHGDW